jgi:hypothetical protein
MLYSPLAVGQAQDGELICTGCGAGIDPDTGRCEDAQALEAYIVKAMGAALTRNIERITAELHTTTRPPDRALVLGFDGANPTDAVVLAPRALEQDD